MDGIYSISFRGTADWGIGMLVLRRGILVGADAGGVTYDGKYSLTGGLLALDASMQVPAGVPLVQGVPPKPAPYTIKFQVTIKQQDMLTGQPVLLQLPPGPVNVIFRRLRQLDD